MESTDSPINSPTSTVIVLVVKHGEQVRFHTLNILGSKNFMDHFKDRGFVVLGFPCNQFGAQEPGSEAEPVVRSLNHGVNFPLHESDRHGDEAHPLFQHLEEGSPGDRVVQRRSSGISHGKRIDKNGIVRKRYAQKDAPTSMADDIKVLLSA